MIHKAIMLKLNELKSPYDNLEKILDSIEGPVLVLDDHFYIRYMNLSWKQFVENKKRTKRNFSDYIHPDDKMKWFDHIRNAEQGEGSALPLLVVRILIPSQDVRWCEVRFNSLYATQFYPISVSLNDVTRVVQTQEVNKANLRNLSGLVRRMPAVLYRARNNISWSMEYISEECEVLTGYTPQQLINQTQLSFGDLIHPDDAKEVWNKVQVALHQHKVFSLTYRLYHTDGTYQEVLEKGQGVYSETGSVLGVEGVILRF